MKQITKSNNRIIPIGTFYKIHINPNASSNIRDKPDLPVPRVKLIQFEELRISFDDKRVDRSTANTSVLPARIESFPWETVIQYRELPRNRWLEALPNGKRVETFKRKRCNSAHSDSTLSAVTSLEPRRRETGGEFENRCDRDSRPCPLTGETVGLVPATWYARDGGRATCQPRGEVHQP